MNSEDDQKLKLDTKVNFQGGSGVDATLNRRRIIPGVNTSTLDLTL